ncbi:kinase-like protein [Thelephora ganbajun]|uniref:Kinase-like protein n=1 Tax=Thelephora ganbajun TaxID=370292 RepID=A0ACB6Z0C6_THEGA|nr:kinase-like protein [Thelephora ganbajun]
MSHPNILSIEGVAPKLFKFCMVSQWMERGNILEYVRKYPEVDRLELLIGVTRGLDHLHYNGIVHGDLKSPNILIDVEGSPRLYDFANCSFTKTDPVSASALSYACTIRWSAPERLDVSVQEREPTTMSDIYSLSMVIVELVTGKMPFPEYTDHNVIVMISEGKRPSKPRHFDAPGMTPMIWKIAQKCWHEKANERPEVDAVLQSLEVLANSGGKHGADLRPTEELDLSFRPNRLPRTMCKVGLEISRTRMACLVRSYRHFEQLFVISSISASLGSTPRALFLELSPGSESTLGIKRNVVDSPLLATGLEA